MVLINCDMGESFGIWRLGDDAGLMPSIHLANVACGFERAELANCLVHQIGALKGFLDAEGMALNHIKPHGCLYRMAARLPAMAHGIRDAADVFRAPLLGLTGTLHEAIYLERGHQLIPEFYADLEYAEDGSLVVTREHPLIDAEKAVARCMRAVREGLVESTAGNDVAVTPVRPRSTWRPAHSGSRPRACAGEEL